MKKLMMILSVALSFGLFADTLPTGVNFEAFNVGAFDFSKLDNGDDQSQATDLAYWISGPNAEGTITEEAGRYEQNEAPDAWKNSVNEKFLHLEGDLVYRTALSCISGDNERNDITTQAADPDTVVSFSENPVYFDTMVKFTAFEDLPTNMVDSAAKLAVFAYAPEDGGYTNLVISGGYVGEGRTFTNYVTDVAVDLSKWYRLTVRALNVGKSGNEPAFLVYLDEELVSRREGDDCGLVTENLNAIGAKNSASIVPSFKAGVEVCAMGFSGTGDIDDLSITDVKPGFIVEESTYTINWSEGVATLKIDDGDAFNVEGSGSTNVALAAGATAVTITATYADGYERGTWKQESKVVEGDEFTDVVGAQLYINAMIPLYDIGGVHYASFLDAMKKVKDGETIKMLADDTATVVAPLNEGTIIIDLAGHTLTGKTAKKDVINSDEGVSLVITNSTSTYGRIIACDPDADYAVWAGADLTIYGGIFDGSIGADANVNVIAGKFLDTYAEGDVDQFYLVSDGTIDAGSVTYAGDDYFQVGEAPEPPTTFTVTVEEAPEHATVTVLSNKTQIAYAESYTLDLEDTLTVTYAIAEGDEDAWEFAQDAVVEFMITKDSASKDVAAPTVVAKQIEPTTYTVTVDAALEHSKVVVLSNDTEIAYAASYTVPAEDVIKVTYTADAGYQFFALMATDTIEYMFNKDSESKEATAPTATLKTFTITYKDAVVTNGVTEFTAETETFALPTAADVEAMAGGQFKGWTNEVSDVLVTEVKKGTTSNLTFYAVWETAGVFYPDYIDLADSTLKDKFDKWATDVAKDRDAMSANRDAFLLNCKPDDVVTEKAKFKITSIVKVGDVWVVKACDKGQNEEYGNGYVNIISVKADKFPTAGEGADFFQATLVIEPVVKE